MNELEYNYLRSLSGQYPTIASASTEIINLQSILNLPKGTEHFMTDIHGVLAEDGSAAVRVTTEEWSAALCRLFRKPIVSTSANISGAAAPACFNDISSEILDSADYVATSRRDEAPEAKPSSVIKLGHGGLIRIIRE